MRDRADFIENLKQAYTHLLILTEDIKYPGPDGRWQKWLDGATLLVKSVYNEIMKEDIEAVLRAVGEQQE